MNVQRLQGPTIHSASEGVLATSFQRLERGWRWIAKRRTDEAVVEVIDMPDQLEGEHDTADGALWTLRELAAGFCLKNRARCLREH